MRWPGRLATGVSFKEGKNVFCLPDRGAGAKLGRLRKTPVLDALPPGRSRDRDRAVGGQNGLQPDKADLWERIDVRHDALQSEDVRSDLAEKEILAGLQNQKIKYLIFLLNINISFSLKSKFLENLRKYNLFLELEDKYCLTSRYGKLLYLYIHNYGYKNKNFYFTFW